MPISVKPPHQVSLSATSPPAFSSPKPCDLGSQSHSPTIPHKPSIPHCRGHLMRCHGFSTHPGEDGEEGERDGCSGCIRSLVHRVVLFFGSLPLVGQKAEANEPQECPKGWDGPPPARQRGRGERSGRHVRANHKHITFLWKLQPDKTHQCTAGWAKFCPCRLSKLSE